MRELTSLHERSAIFRRRDVSSRKLSGFNDANAVDRAIDTISILISAPPAFVSVCERAQPI